MKINKEFSIKVLTNFIREELHKFGFSKGILGISGGLDSSVTAYLAVRALGASNVLGLIMPYRDTFDQDKADADFIIKDLGMPSKTIDISPAVDAFYNEHPSSDRVLRGNKMARERMSVLYEFSAREKALILGTSNKTELLLGYGTIHGDMACAINPVGDLYKTQMRILGRYLGVPDTILNKAPTAGLWEGQTDEADLGLKYETIDKILFLLVDQRKSRREVQKAGFKTKDIDRIIKMIKSSEFKRRMPPIAKISQRTIGLDFLHPYDWDK